MALALDLEKTCSKCGVSKLLTEFDFRRRGQTRRASQCKACKKDANRSYYDRMSPTQRDAYLARKQRVAPLSEDERAANRARYLLTAHGITEEQYQEKLVAQGGVCYICGTDEPGTRGGKFCVAHNHLTGKIRKLLCTACNVRLGYIEAPSLDVFLRYLEEHE